MTDLTLFPLVDAPRVTRWTALFSSKSDEWATADEVVADLSRSYGPFTLDVAATPGNAKAARFFTEADDGLSKSWADESGGGAVWCNPPYSDVEAWVAKALAESLRGVTVVLLLPSRTDTRWFHLVLAAQERCEILFCRGRLRFGDAKSTAPFPSLAIVCKGRR
jgi:phage N-6-adenine-methyltransferase